MIEKYAKKRAELKAILADPETSDEDFYKAQAAVDKAAQEQLTNPCTQPLLCHRSSTCFYP